MPRLSFSLRTLIIVMLLGGPVCAWGWQQWEAWRAAQEQAEIMRIVNLLKANGGGVRRIQLVTPRVLVHGGSDEYLGLGPIE